MYIYNRALRVFIDSDGVRINSGFQVWFSAHTTAVETVKSQHSPPHPYYSFHPMVVQLVVQRDEILSSSRSTVHIKSPPAGQVRPERLFVSITRANDPRTW